MTDIFISYRRDGGDMTAMYIYQALKERGYNVFYDVEVLRSGKFNEELLKHIQSCRDFIIILSPHALDRCVDPQDWVRQEIAEAIRENKNIVPIMMNGFRFPDELPEEINAVRYHTGLSSSTEYFQESIHRLCEKFLTSKAKKKRNWLLPSALAAAVCALAAVLMLQNPLARRQAPAEATTSVPQPSSVEKAAEPPSEPTAAPAAQLVHTELPVLALSVEVNDGSAAEESAEYGPIGEYERHWPAMGNAAYTREQIGSVTFLPSLEKVPASAWDVSQAGDGSVMAWLTPDGEFYDLCVAGDGGVKIPDAPGTDQLFAGYCNAKSISFNGCVDLSEREELAHMFWGCRSLSRIDFSGISTAGARNLNGMFGGCARLQTLDLSFMDTAHADDMSELFLDCESLETLVLGDFDTSKAVNMSSMFNNCPRLSDLDVSGFDTSRAETTAWMFGSCRYLENLDLSGWNTAEVTDMSYMFYGCDSLYKLDLNGFETGKTENMSGMFMACTRLKEAALTDWNVDRVQSMRMMFAGCEALESIGRDPATFGHGDTTDMYADCGRLPGVLSAGD